MRFGPWLPLADAPTLAPGWPGVLQTRGDVLQRLPHGKSAMILYAATSPGEPLRDFVTTAGADALARAQSLGAHLIRFGESADPSADLARLLDQFLERFGALPPANS